MENLKIIANTAKKFILMNWKKLVISLSALLIILILLFVISILTNPMNTKITRKNYDNVVEKIRKNSSKENYEKVQAVIAMAEMASWGEDKDKIDIIEGKSFNQMIKTIQKNIEQEEKEAEQQKAVAIEKQKIREQYFEVRSWSYDIVNIHPYEKGVKIYLEAENKKNIDIDAFEGILTVKDKLGNIVLETKLTCNINFPKKSEEVFNWTLSEIDYYSAVKDISQFNGKDGALTFYFDISKLIVNGQEI